MTRLEQLLMEPRWLASDGTPLAGPDNCWNRVGGLVKLFCTARPSTVVEVGCHRGVSTRVWLEHSCRVTAVDTWPDESDYSHFMRLRDHYPNLVAVHRMLSSQAALLVPDVSVDLVYIDANHDYDSVVADLRTWLPKIRPWGWIAGHDFTHHFPGVIQAVERLKYVPQLFSDSSWLVGL